MNEEGGNDNVERNGNPDNDILKVQEEITNLQSSLHYAIGKLCLQEDENDSFKNTLNNNVAETPSVKTSSSAIATLTEMAFYYITKNLSNDLHAFSSHGNRKVITVDDVKLVLRKDQRLSGMLQTFCDENCEERQHVGSARRKSASKAKTKKPTNNASNIIKAINLNDKFLNESSTDDDSCCLEEGAFRKTHKKRAQEKNDISKTKKNNIEILDDDDENQDQNSDDNIVIYSNNESLDSNNCDAGSINANSVGELSFVIKDSDEDNENENELSFNDDKDENDLDNEENTDGINLDYGQNTDSIKKPSPTSSPFKEDGATNDSNSDTSPTNKKTTPLDEDECISISSCEKSKPEEKNDTPNEFSFTKRKRGRPPKKKALAQQDTTTKNETRTNSAASKTKISATAKSKKKNDSKNVHMLHDDDEDVDVIVSKVFSNKNDKIKSKSKKKESARKSLTRLKKKNNTSTGKSKMRILLNSDSESSDF